MNSKVSRQSNQSSIRLIQILECLSSNRAPMKLQEIAIKTGLTQSTVLRYIYTLQDENYVFHDEDTSRYALTWKVCQLSDNVRTLLSLRNITTSFVNLLANKLSLGSCLVIEQDFECMYLDCIDNPNTATLQRIGKRAAMHSTGSGKVLLSQFSESQLSSYIASKGLVSFTDKTITNSEVLISELEKIRAQGYALDDEECELGLRCVSMPLRDYTGKIIAAMSVFGTPDDMTDLRIHTEIIPLLSDSTKAISRRLGFAD